MDSRELKLTDLIRPRKNDPGYEVQAMAEDITKYGLAYPILVEAKGKKYVVIDGEQRIKAYEALGKTEIEVNILPK